MEVQFQALFNVQYGKKRGETRTRLGGISFTNYPNTVFLLEKALKLQAVEGSWLIFTNSGFFFSFEG